MDDILWFSDARRLREWFWCDYRVAWQKRVLIDKNSCSVRAVLVSWATVGLGWSSIGKR